MKEQKKRELDFKNMHKVRGELLMNIRAALQNMNEMLICVEAKSMRSKGQKIDIGNKKEPALEEAHAEEELDKMDEPQIRKIETNGNSWFITNN